MIIEGEKKLKIKENTEIYLVIKLFLSLVVYPLERLHSLLFDQLLNLQLPQR